MKRTAEMAVIRQRMEGIIALLLALATIADRACRAPFPVRVHVLSLLRPAESAARDYVCGETGFVCGETGFPAPLPAPADDHVADAAGLAARFRLLAIALTGVAALLFSGCRLDDGVKSLRTACEAAGVMRDARGPAFPLLRPFDTS